MLLRVACWLCGPVSCDTVVCVSVLASRLTVTPVLSPVARALWAVSPRTAAARERTCRVSMELVELPCMALDCVGARVCTAVRLPTLRGARAVGTRERRGAVVPSLS